MRMRILREGTPTDDGRVIVAGTTEWAHAVPVYNHERKPVGALIKVRREHDGWITGVITGVKVARGYGLQAEIRSAPGTEVDPEAMTGVLQGVTVGSTTAWPGMKR